MNVGHLDSKAVRGAVGPVVEDERDRLGVDAEEYGIGSDSDPVKGH